MTSSKENEHQVSRVEVSPWTLGSVLAVSDDFLSANLTRWLARAAGRLVEPRTSRRSPQDHLKPMAVFPGR